MRGEYYLIAGQGGVEASDEGVRLQLRHGPREPRVQGPYQGAPGPGQGEQRHRARGEEPLTNEKRSIGELTNERRVLCKSIYQ